MNHDEGRTCALCASDVASGSRALHGFGRCVPKIPVTGIDFSAPTGDENFRLSIDMVMREWPPRSLDLRLVNADPEVEDAVQRYECAPKPSKAVFGNAKGRPLSEKMFREVVQLTTGPQLELVAYVEIPPFEVMPDVINYGDRVFTREEFSHHHAFIYCEVFAYTVPPAADGGSDEQS